MTKSSGEKKGASLEETLRAFFLRAGFFVIRGVPFRFADEDLTDVDLWLYERPTGTSRRVQICDIKYKQKPKAVERIFWTRGLATALRVDGAYVATTDKRLSLRHVASKLDILLIDGTDIQRIQTSHAVADTNRISDEELIDNLKTVDKQFKNKELQDSRIDIISSLSEGFGAPSAVRSLAAFCRLAANTVSYHPDSEAAKASGRLAYLAAAISCESLDYVSVGAAFRTLDERRELLLNAVRLGALSNGKGQQSLKLALALIEKYSPNGRGLAVTIESNLKKDLDSIPAEIVVDQAVRLLKSNQLFSVGRELEAACYQNTLPNFDNLSIETKSMLGALLDYAGIDREKFAHAWNYKPAESIPTDASESKTSSSPNQSSLFEK